MRLLSGEWSLRAGFEDVKSQLVEANGEPIEDDGTVYRWEFESGISDRFLKLDRDQGTLSLAVHVSDALKNVLYVLVGVFAVGVLSDISFLLNVGTAASLLLVFVLRKHTQPPRDEHLEISSLRVSWYYFVSIALAILFVFPSSLGGNGFFQLIYIGVAIFILLEHFAQGSLPIDSEYLPDPGSSQSHLHIPILGLIAPVLAYALFNFFNLLRLSSVPYWIIVPVVSISAILVTWGYMIACRDALDRVRFDRNAAYSSRGIQILTLLLYLIGNVASLLMLVVWIDLLSFGVRGQGLFETFGPQGVELLSSVYTALDSTLATLPVLPPRVYSMLFLSLNFLPALLLLGMWLVFLITNAVSKLRILSNSHEYPIETAEPVGVTVLCVDIGWPVVKPLTLLLGWKQYVVVDQSVIEKLSENELNAVLAHEFYHLRRQEALINLFASFVSVLTFGGKNALLAFYNYPQIEEDADRHAAERCGKMNLITALRKLEDLQAESEGSIQGTVGFPGFIGQREDSNPVNQTESPDTGSSRNRFSLLREELVAPYGLFYGSVLFDEAHRPIDERIQLISNFDI